MEQGKPWGNTRKKEPRQRKEERKGYEHEGTGPRDMTLDGLYETLMDDARNRRTDRMDQIAR